MVQRDDVEEHYDEDPDGEEEYKDDGSTHATVVSDLAETAKPKGEREVLESERNQTNQAKPDEPGERPRREEGERGS